MLDITDGYDKDPIQFVDSIKSFLDALEEIMLT
jgi:hypothetical protein